jgi:hypothetical protein
MIKATFYKRGEILIGFEIDGHSGAIRDWDAESVYDD